MTISSVPWRIPVWAASWKVACSWYKTCIWEVYEIKTPYWGEDCYSGLWCGNRRKWKCEVDCPSQSTGENLGKNKKCCALSCLCSQAGRNIWPRVFSKSSKMTSPLPRISMNKTNHLISNNSHPSSTANKVIRFLKWGWGGVTKPTGTSYFFDKVWSGAPDGIIMCTLESATFPWVRSHAP